MSVVLRILAGALVAGVTSASAERVCEAPGCFELTATGSATVTNAVGTATYEISPAGHLSILLTTTSPTMTVLITRVGTSASEVAENLRIDTKRCDDDMDEDAEDAKGTVSVVVAKGTSQKPRWLAIGSSGTVTLSRSAGIVAGTFNVKACGDPFNEDDDDVIVNVHGTFKARAVKR